MSGKLKSGSKLGNLLDKLFKRKHLSFWTPIFVAALLYILFLIFGQNPDKNDIILKAPLIALLWFGGVFLVMGVQLRNPSCSAKTMDIFEICLVLYSLWSAAVCIISFLMNVQSGFLHVTLAALITWSATSLIHNLRK